MFGAKPGSFGGGFGGGTNSFGSPAPFGQTGTGFGGQVFGSNTQTPTGVAGLFGQNASSGGTGGGLFGQQSSGFGSFGGTPTSSSLFGGQQQQQQQQQQNPGGGLFSAGASQNAFGAKPNTFGGFGGGTQSTGTGLFGGVSQSTTSSLFGQNTATAGMFGGATGTTVTGTLVKFNPPVGTDTMIKNGVTTNISIRHQCVTAMKEYENKSLEELRMEDYTAGRKGKQGGGLFGATPSTQPSAGFGGFNQSTGFGTSTGFGAGTSTSTNGGLFGGQQSTGQFGQFKPLFGSTSQPSTTSFSFSTPAPTGTSLFGQPQNKTPFGTATTTQAGLFGAANTFGTPSSGFGSSPFGTQNQSGGLFGSKPAGFGTATTTTSGFGFSSGSNLFAKPATSTTSQFNFGTSTSTTGFGANTGGGLFGNKPTGFGQPAPSLTTGTSGFNFGGANMNTGTSGNLFGNAQNKSFGTFNFGNPSSGTGLAGFGTTNTFSLGNNATLGGSTTTSSTAQLHQHLMAQSPFGDSSLFWSLKTSPKKEEGAKPTSPGVQKALLSNTPQYKVSPRPTPRVRPKSLHSYLNGGTAQVFEGLEDEDFGFGMPECFTPRKSVKKLVLKRGPGGSGISSRPSSTSEPPDSPAAEESSAEQPSLNPRPGSGFPRIEHSPPSRPSPAKTGTSLQRESGGASLQRESGGTSLQRESGGASLQRESGGASLRRESRGASQQRESGGASLQRESGGASLQRESRGASLQRESGGVSLQRENRGARRNSGGEMSGSWHTDSEETFSKQRLGASLSSPEKSAADNSLDNSHLQHEDLETDLSLEPEAEEGPQHPAGVVLTRPGYYTVPSMEELALMADDDGNCLVENFTIGREKYGSLYFPGITNVANLNLDDIVHFRRKEVVVYPDDDKKPLLGQGLNKTAEITLDCVWPNDKTTKLPIKDLERLRTMDYQKKLEDTTARFGGKFIDYRPETGSWVFLVKHFSSYGVEG